MSICPFLSKSVSIAYAPSIDTTSTLSVTSDDGLGNIITTDTITRTPFDPINLVSENIISQLTNVMIDPGLTMGLKSVNMFGDNVVGTQSIFVECVQTQCQLWDATNSNCSIQILSNKLSTLTTNFSDVVGTSADAAANIARHRGDATANPKSSIVNLLKHEDAKHDNVNLNNTPKTAKSNTLMMEYMGSEDLDGNGKVFGVDFALKDDDSKPTSLKSLDSSIARLGLPEISYADYKTWMEDETAPNPLA